MDVTEMWMSTSSVQKDAYCCNGSPLPAILGKGCVLLLEESLPVAAAMSKVDLHFWPFSILLFSSQLLSEGEMNYSLMSYRDDSRQSKYVY